MNQAIGTQFIGTVRSSVVQAYNATLDIKSDTLRLGPVGSVPATVTLEKNSTTGVTTTTLAADETVVTGSLRVTGNTVQTGDHVQAGTMTARTVTGVSEVRVGYSGSTIDGAGLVSSSGHWGMTSNSNGGLVVKASTQAGAGLELEGTGGTRVYGALRGDGGAVIDGTTATEVLQAATSLSVGIGGSVSAGAVIMPTKWDFTGSTDGTLGNVLTIQSSTSSNQTKISDAAVVAPALESGVVQNLDGASTHLLINGRGQNIVMTAPTVTATQTELAGKVQATDRLELLGGASINGGTGELATTVGSQAWSLKNTWASNANTLGFTLGSTSIVTFGSSVAQYAVPIETTTVQSQTALNLTAATHVKVSAPSGILAEHRVVGQAGFAIPKAAINTSQANWESTTDSFRLAPVSGDATRMALTDNAATYLTVYTSSGVQHSDFTGIVSASSKLQAPEVVAQTIGDASQVVTIRGTSVTIDADRLDIRGSVNATNTTHMNVEDKELRLGYSNTPGSISLRDTAAITVEGTVDNLPVGANGADYGTKIMWKHNSGLFDGANTSVAPHTRQAWDVRNANFTLTGPGPNSASFTFAVDGDQLKIFKKTSAGDITLVAQMG